METIRFGLNAIPKIHKLVSIHACVNECIVIRTVSRLINQASSVTLHMSSECNHLSDEEACVLM
jgi:hypothetical protein